MIEGIETREGLEELQGHCEAILELLGENKYREGLVKTPYRVAKAMQKLTCGYGMDPKAVLNGAKFKEDYSEKKFSKEYTIKYVILSATENLRCFAIVQHDEWAVILSATKDLRMF